MRLVKRAASTPLDVGLLQLGLVLCENGFDHVSERVTLGDVANVVG